MFIENNSVYRKYIFAYTDFERLISNRHIMSKVSKGFATTNLGKPTKRLRLYVPVAHRRGRQGGPGPPDRIKK